MTNKAFLAQIAVIRTLSVSPFLWLHFDVTDLAFEELTMLTFRPIAENAALTHVILVQNFLVLLTIVWKLSIKGAVCLAIGNFFAKSFNDCLSVHLIFTFSEMLVNFLEVLEPLNELV